MHDLLLGSTFEKGSMKAHVTIGNNAGYDRDRERFIISAGELGLLRLVKKYEGG